MRPVAVARHLRDLWRVSGVASRVYGGSRAHAAQIALRLRRQNGFDLGEALRWGLLDPTLDDGERYAWVGRARRRPAQDRLNPVSLEGFSEHKLLFYEYCAALDIPVPRLYGAAGRAAGWNRVSGDPIVGRDAFAAFIADLQGDLVVKPAFGAMGTGIRVLTRDGEMLVDGSGHRFPPASLYDMLVADPEHDLHVVQERLRNHPVIDRVVGSSVLQTLRVMTLVRPDGSVVVFGAIFKVATGEGHIDNFLSGSTGNGFCRVSPEAGELGPLQMSRSGGAGLVALVDVPRTGRRIAGVRLPFAAEARELVRAAAPDFLPMRTLGWDVAITPDGPVVLEANNWWAPFTPLPNEVRRILLGA